MSEFERKPDGGLNNWIETYEAMGGGENDAEMLCLLLELRRRRVNEPELKGELEVAERERDEYKHRCKVSDGTCDIAEQQRDHWMQRAKAAEEELARRDAAAGEADPVGLINGEREPVLYGAHIGIAIGEKLYTAAPPAVFPCASDASQGWEVNPEYLQSVATRSCDADGVNPSLETVESVILALGAQPQKPVVLPAMFNLKMAGDVKTKQYFKGSNDTIKQIAGLLDAANVKYEVKK